MMQHQQVGLVTFVNISSVDEPTLMAQYRNSDQWESDKNWFDKTQSPIGQIYPQSLAK